MPLLLFLLGWVVYFFLIWRNMFTIENDTVFVKSANVWGDWAMHFTQTSQFVYRSLIPGDHPILEGAPYAYPFGVNWITAILVRSGVEFFQAHILVSYLLSILLVVLLIVVFYRTLKRAGLAIGAGLLFFLNGGVGIVLFFADRLGFSQLPTDFHGEYTLIASVGLRWINMITSMMIPQRAFLLGFSTGLLALLLLIQEIQKKASEWRVSRFLIAGVLLGLLPVMHMHSYLALAMVCGWYLVWTLFRNRTSSLKMRKVVLCWAMVLIPAIAIPLPLLMNQYADTIGKTAQGSFMQWYPGWFTNEASDYPEMSVIWFWLMNWGVVLPLAVVGFFMIKPVQRGILIPFIGLFVVSNLFLFQPFVWDNTKILIWSSLGISMLAAVPIWRLIQTRNFGLRILGGLIFLIAIMSGAHDAGRLILPDVQRFGMYSLSEIRLARELRELSDPNDTIITSPHHNNPFINLSGRNILLGYKGWLWTYGLPYHEIDQEIVEILGGGERSESLIHQYNVKFVVIDPLLEREWIVNREFFEDRYPVIYQDESRTIFETAEFLEDFEPITEN